MVNRLNTYLLDRSKVVSINREISSKMTLNFGATKGSVLNPVLYTLYIVPLGFVKGTPCKLHMYVHDTTPNCFRPSSHQTSPPFSKKSRDVAHWLINGWRATNWSSTMRRPSLVILCDTEQKIQNQNISFIIIPVGNDIIPIFAKAKKPWCYPWQLCLRKWPPKWNLSKPSISLSSSCWELNEPSSRACYKPLCVLLLYPTWITVTDFWPPWQHHK